MRKKAASGTSAINTTLAAIPAIVRCRRCRWATSTRIESTGGAIGPGRVAARWPARWRCSLKSSVECMEDGPFINAARTEFAGEGFVGAPKHRRNGAPSYAESVRNRGFGEIGDISQDDGFAGAALSLIHI